MCFGAKIGKYKALHWDDYDSKKHTMYISKYMADRPEDGKNRVAAEINHTKSNSVDGRRRIPASPIECIRQILGHTTTEMTMHYVRKLINHLRITNS